jgi:hypothetical protein
MAQSRTGVLGFGIALGMVAILAGCETSDRDEYGGGYSSRSGGGMLGSMLGQQVSYRCDDNRGFTASFQPLGGGASVNVGGQTYRLRSSGSEYRSEDGDVRLQVDGDQAYLRIADGQDYQDCEAR